MYYPEKIGRSDNAPWRSGSQPCGDYLRVRHLLFNDYSIGLHSHDDYHELNFIIGGQGVVYIADRIFELSVGDFFVMPPGDSHGYYSCDKLSVYHILIHNDFLLKRQDEFLPLPGYSSLFNIRPSLRILAGIPGFLHLAGRDYDRIFGQIEHTAMTAVLPDIGISDALHIHSQTEELIADLCEIYVRQAAAPGPKSGHSNGEKLLVSFFEIVSSRYGEPLNVETIADELSVSRSKIHDVFREYLGLTPNEYIVDFRLEKAKELLEGSDMSVAEIAAECGFYDSSHLVRTMKRRKNLLPTDLRKRRNGSP